MTTVQRFLLWFILYLKFKLIKMNQIAELILLAGKTPFLGKRTRPLAKVREPAGGWYSEQDTKASPSIWIPPARHLQAASPDYACMHSGTWLGMVILDSSNQILGIFLIPATGLWTQIVASPSPTPTASGPAWAHRRGPGNTPRGETPLAGPSLPAQPEPAPRGGDGKGGFTALCRAGPSGAERGLYPLGCEWRRAV